jgi:7-carboxy-7-deazaguanine synthase
MDTLTATTDSLVVAECFGPTAQGEGPSLGRRASFIRLGGCNLHCSWCDSKFTWDASRFDLRAELTRRPVDSIVSEVATHGTKLVVITGGEPLLHQHQPAWPTLLIALAAAGCDIEIETNGTQAPSAGTSRWVTRFNVSPKLANSGDTPELRIAPAALAVLLGTGKAAFKFVCRDPADLAEAQHLTVRHSIPPHLVWIMPEGTDAATICKRLTVLADPAINAGFNVTTRLHVLAWGDERGR